jgi:hypothetical protein
MGTGIMDAVKDSTDPQQSAMKEILALLGESSKPYMWLAMMPPGVICCTCCCAST